MAVLRSERNAFQPSTVIVEQFRAPVGKYVVGQSGDTIIIILSLTRSHRTPRWYSLTSFEIQPSLRFDLGLIDEGETAEETAIRELQEETGFKGTKVLESSPLLVCDPGMTTANMKLVAVDVPFLDKLEVSQQKLEPGEFITARIVELHKLDEELKGMKFHDKMASLLTCSGSHSL